MFSISPTFCLAKFSDVLAKSNPGYQVITCVWILFDLAVLVLVELKTIGLILLFNHSKEPMLIELREPLPCHPQNAVSVKNMAYHDSVCFS